MNILRHLLKVQQLGIITGIFLVVIFLKLLGVISQSWVCLMLVQFVGLIFVLFLGIFVVHLHMRLTKAQLEKSELKKHYNPITEEEI